MINKNLVYLNYWLDMELYINEMYNCYDTIDIKIKHRIEPI